MVDPDFLQSIGRRHTVDYLAREAYVIDDELAGEGSTLVGAEKFGKKYLFAVKVVPVHEGERPAKGAEDFTHEARRELIARCAKTGAIAMLAIVAVGGDEGHEGELLPPIKFKRI